MKSTVTILRKWNNPQIAIRLSNEALELDMSLEEFLHGLLGGVAHGELGAELVVFAHQGWQAADDLQVLCGADAGGAGAKQAG